MGRSLGVELITAKTCSFDCLFCESGPTTVHTLHRDRLVPVGDVLDELSDWFDRGGTADYVTLAGAGEPTLHLDFGRVLEALKPRPVQSALLTNSSLMHLPEVRRDAAMADLVKASLSAWDETSFRRLNRPCDGVDFREILDGLTAFRSAFTGRFWLEVMVLDGINDNPADMRRIAEQVKAGTLQPESVDEACVAANLYAPDIPYPDLLIRTSGEMRISNFLLWQLSYAELYVTPVCWPDFREPHFRAALDDYARRSRRFGGIEPEVKR